jgi:hypothetical protein
VHAVNGFLSEMADYSAYRHPSVSSPNFQSLDDRRLFSTSVTELRVFVELISKVLDLDNALPVILIADEHRFIGGNRVAIDYFTVVVLNV